MSTVDTAAVCGSCGKPDPLNLHLLGCDDEDPCPACGGGHDRIDPETTPCPAEQQARCGARADEVGGPDNWVCALTPQHFPGRLHETATGGVWGENTFHGPGMCEHTDCQPVEPEPVTRRAADLQPGDVVHLGGIADGLGEVRYVEPITDGGVVILFAGGRVHNVSGDVRYELVDDAAAEAWRAEREADWQRSDLASFFEWIAGNLRQQGLPLPTYGRMSMIPYGVASRADLERVAAVFGTTESFRDNGQSLSVDVEQHGNSVHVYWMYPPEQSSEVTV